MTIKKNNLVEKQNILNEMRSKNMTLQELRFFSIYLSKINARDISTRKVIFPLEDFQKIMEFGRLNINQLKTTTDSLLCKIVHLPTERGGYTSFQLFKECSVDQDEYGSWFVEIDAHDKALPLMFDFKSRYFTYQLWNALHLKSSNQLRMYELLKQYEKSGVREISLLELRELLGIEKEEYPRWERFKVRVIDSCQQALLESTDIKFTYETIKKGRGGKITALKFTIEKNENHIDNLTLDEYIEQQPLPELECELKAFCFENETLEFLAESCNNEFNEPQMQVIYDLVKEIIPFSSQDVKIERYNYLLKKYNEFNLRVSSISLSPIKNHFAYFKSLIEADLNKENQKYE